MRVVTTGGGGWGDPLEREPEWVARDVSEGKVSPQAARADYGVVLTPDAAGDSFTVDVEATAALRRDIKAARRSAPPMIDRGSGFDQMLRGEVKPWVRTG